MLPGLYSLGQSEVRLVAKTAIKMPLAGVFPGKANLLDIVAARSG